MTSGSNPFEDIDRLFDRMSEQFETLDPADFGVPDTPLPIDVLDEGETFLVIADLPGYDPDDIDVAMPLPRTLRIEANRETRTTDEDSGVRLRAERREAVGRSVSLPAAAADDETTATHDDGVLTVRLPKRDRMDDEGGVSVPVN